MVYYYESMKICPYSLDFKQPTGVSRLAYRTDTVAWYARPSLKINYPIVLLNHATKTDSTNLTSYSLFMLENT